VRIGKESDVEQHVQTAQRPCLNPNDEIVTFISGALLLSASAP
jgi:hypothetical protein